MERKREDLLCPFALMIKTVEASPEGWKRACPFMLESGGSILVLPQIQALYPAIKD